LRRSIWRNSWIPLEEVNLEEFVDSLEKQLLRELWASPLEEVHLGDFLDSLEEQLLRELWVPETPGSESYHKVEGKIPRPAWQ